jgi:hypothetical protein
MRGRYLTGALVAALLLPSGAAAQSLLSSRGLGFPVDPVDARSRALGGVGVGLFQPSLTPVDPAASADLAVPALNLTVQSLWADAGVEGANDPQGTRFPLLGLAYPVPGLGMASLTFSGVLDQRFRVDVPREIVIGGENTGVTDRFLSDGGVSSVRFGLARRLSPSLAVGASVGRYVGEVTRTFTRSFDSLQVGTGRVPDFRSQGSWAYGGFLATVGAQIDVGSIVRAAGSVTWSGELDAEPSGTTEGPTTSFEMPLEVRAGASGRLTPDLALVLGLTWADWSDSEGEVETGLDATSTLGIGTGLEFTGFSLASRTLPIRLGYRWSELPFPVEGEAFDESSWTGGVGLNVVESAGIPLATVHLSLERGSRSGATLDEPFWRGALSMRVAGF